MTIATKPGKTGRVWIALGALVAGIVCGNLVSSAGQPALNAVADSLEPIGVLWTRALVLIVIPFVVSSIVVAVLSTGGSRGMGRLTLASIAVFLAILAASMFIVFMLAPFAISALQVQPGALDGVSPPIPETAAAMVTRNEGIDLGAWLVSLVPTNVVQAAAEGEILQLVLVSILFSLAVNRTAPEQVALIRACFVSLRDAMLVLIRWCLALMVPAMFILALGLGRRAGLDSVPALLSYVVLDIVFLAGGVLFLYVIAIVIGRVRPVPFFRALLPAQTVAIGTRSSMASVPALMEGAREHMSLSRTAGEIILPLAAAMFKANKGITNPLKLLFLAHVYGVELGAGDILTFMATVCLLSLGAPGLPAGTGPVLLLPAYLQAGIPMEGYFIIRLVSPIPDIMMTLMNTTGILTATTVISRLPLRVGEPTGSSALVGKEAST